MSHVLKERVPSQHDNTPSYISCVAMDAVHQAGFQLVEYPFYSSDLAHPDYRLFLKRKKNIFR